MKKKKKKKSWRNHPIVELIILGDNPTHRHPKSSALSVQGVYCAFLSFPAQKTSTEEFLAGSATSFCLDTAAEVSGLAYKGAG